MSDSLSSEYDDDDNWMLDLETTLLENCDFFKIRSICKDRPIPCHLRNEVWKICLNINPQIDQLENFNDLFDLPNQDILHENCCEFVATLPKDLFVNSIGFISDIEIILTYFSRTYKIKYEENNGWLSILRILCCELKLNKRGDLYNYFSAICHRFLPSPSVLNGEIFSVFRLLLQYHDPELCSFLDTHRITPELYAYNWFTSLFSSHISIDALVKLWDIYFLVADPFLMFYLALIVILNLRDTLFEMRGCEKQTILNKIQSTLRAVSHNDVEDFHSLAQHYIAMTPKSFSCKFSPILFGNAHKDSEIQSILDSLCMPISIHELLESKSRDVNLQSINYFLVDCRPADQYNAGHLPSAYFLDSSLIISSPSDDFQTSVGALLLTQQQALEFHSQSAGEHICFLGSGNHEEDQIVNMVVAQFLQKMTKFVSMVYGGYRAIHEVLGPQCDHFFIGHDSTSCHVCLSHVSSSNDVNHQPSSMIGFDPSHHSMTIDGDGARPIQTGDQRDKLVDKLLTRFSSTIKLNSSRFRSKLTNYVVKTESTTESDVKHASNTAAIATVSKRRPSNNATGKSYRNTGNIFSIDDEGDQDITIPSSQSDRNMATQSPPPSPKQPEMINLDLWATARPDVIAIFDCCIVDETRALQPGHLLLTRTHLFVLKRSAASRFDNPINQLLHQLPWQQSQQQQQQPANMVSIYRRRVLSSVVKITSKRKYPECLTFHYLLSDGATVERDQYVIDQAGEAARLIKIQVQKMIDDEDTAQ